MKKWAGLFLAAALILPALLPSRAQSAIIISELCDPLNNYLTDRFIEIANAGTDTVDLSGWTLIAISNRNTVTPAYFTWPLSGLIAPGQAKVCGGTAPVAVFPIVPAPASSSGMPTWSANPASTCRTPPTPPPSGP
jgi:hypothetical protein